MYLIDTNVVSELRKSRKADSGVREWAQALPAASLYLSVISIVELEIGILLVERRDRKQSAVLRAWMDRHVLPHLMVAFLQSILRLLSDARSSTCLTLAPTATLSSRQPR